MLQYTRLDYFFLTSVNGNFLGPYVNPALESGWAIAINVQKTAYVKIVTVHFSAVL